MILPTKITYHIVGLFYTNNDINDINDIKGALPRI